jgi:hypothetical protein
MLRALLAHPQEALHKRQLAAPGLVQPTDITRTQYTKCYKYNQVVVKTQQFYLLNYL